MEAGALVRHFTVKIKPIGVVSIFLPWASSFLMACEELVYDKEESARRSLYIAHQMLVCAPSVIQT